MSLVDEESEAAETVIEKSGSLPGVGKISPGESWRLCGKIVIYVLMEVCETFNRMLQSQKL
jgi:hypothetical protein